MYDVGISPRNEKMSELEFYETIRKDPLMYVGKGLFGPHEIFKWKIVVHRYGAVYLFYACEWCGGKELDKNDNCTRCGGYVTADETHRQEWDRYNHHTYKETQHGYRN